MLGDLGPEGRDLGMAVDFDGSERLRAHTDLPIFPRTTPRSRRVRGPSRAVHDWTVERVPGEEASSI